MIGGYTTLNSKINQTITLIEDVSQGSREEEKGIIQINDTINTLDQATQVNANSATKNTVKGLGRLMVGAIVTLPSNVLEVVFFKLALDILSIKTDVKSKLIPGTESFGNI